VKLNAVRRAHLRIPGAVIGNADRWRPTRLQGDPAGCIVTPTRLIANGRDMSRFALKSSLVALVTMIPLLSPTSFADTGTVRISFIKAGWVIGGTVGSGTLTFRGRTYPLTIGGLSYGLTFGGSQTHLRGRVSNIFRPTDIEGVYGAAGAGAAVI